MFRIRAPLAESPPGLASREKEQKERDTTGMLIEKDKDGDQPTKPEDKGDTAPAVDIGYEVLSRPLSFSRDPDQISRSWAH